MSATVCTRVYQSACVVLVIAALVTMTDQLCAWSQSSARPLNWAADDATRIAHLHEGGIRVEGQQVIVWFPPQALVEPQRQELVDNLDRGVTALRALIGAHPWQRLRDQKITYYISPEHFIAHATGRGTVLMPLVRLLEGRAPFLHESAHELLFPQPPSAPDDPSPAGMRVPLASRPVWLSEGMADYVAQTVAAETGFAEGDVFNVGGLARVDTTCMQRLQGPRGAEVLRSIGEAGAPEALFTTERQAVAPTFYACAQSFTKFLVARVGLQAMVELFPLIREGKVDERLAQLTQSSLPLLRAEWLRTIGYTAAIETEAR
jgi:hypothetical protein